MFMPVSSPENDEVPAAQELLTERPYIGYILVLAGLAEALLSAKAGIHIHNDTLAIHPLTETTERIGGGVGMSWIGLNLLRNRNTFTGQSREH